MEKRIELEKRGRPAAQITELNLDNCRSTTIVGLSDDYENLVSLSLINVGLTTLKGFPKLPKLKKLELSDNRISNGLTYLESSPNITTLNLSGNRLADLDSLKPLESFKQLEVLDLFNNEVTGVDNYREKVFALIPSLKYLDGFDSQDVEALSEGEDDEDANGANDGSDGGEGESEEEDDDDDSSEDKDLDNGDVSLSEVYNDELEEDNSDWDAGEEEVEDEEDSSDEEGDDESKTTTAKTGDTSAAAKEKSKSPSAAADESKANEENAEDSEARGKKRKHDG